VNMSLGGPASTTIDNAVQAIVNRGLTVASSAGNFEGGPGDLRLPPGDTGGGNACNYSPARLPSVLTVGASDPRDDTETWFSFYGDCVDLFAPGDPITSAYHMGDNATRTLWGTSMAAPHVAGIAATYVEANPGASPAQVKNAILSNATTGKITWLGGPPNSANLLAYSAFVPAAPQQPPGQPAAPMDACPPGVPPAGFTDTHGNTHRVAIDCVVWHAVAQGTSATTYSPGATVTRAQMASFIGRLVEAAGATLPAGGGRFTDIAGNVHARNIERLAAAGIVQGVGGGRYAPSETVKVPALLTRESYGNACSRFICCCRAPVRFVKRSLASARRATTSERPAMAMPTAPKRIIATMISTSDTPARLCGRP
jgi:hypothetical protein